ncbi:MAG: methyl-accepting chemotaxis protein [Sulfurimicrobium sp.]|nr:methyl-accepting chemotaxis protein [Sulfurimicrobium sp.]MDP2197532.1 methyl-accepting chemotaxis protein [Sulfurimicrobium sp.]MDP3686338.1 methyl-accepting chemotaxis protein [Sulfurimicrobium sp.]
MAFKIENLMFWKSKGKNKNAGESPMHTTMILQGLRNLSGKEPGSVPIIGHLPIEKQYLITVSTLALFLVLAVATLVYNTLQVGRNAEYVAISTEMQMLSQRIAKSAQQAAQGNTTAFKQLGESEIQFEKNLKKLINGGDGLPASPSSIQPMLKELDGHWEPTEKAIYLILPQEKKLVELNHSVAAINANNIQLLELAEQVVALLTQSAAPLREISIASQLVMLTQRLAKNANTLLSSDVIDPEVAFLLGKDANTFQEMIDGLISGSEDLRLTAVRDPDTRDKLDELSEAFKEFSGHSNTILQSMQELVNSKQAGRNIFVGSDKLLDDTRKLVTQYEQQAGGTGLLILSFVYGLLAVGSLVMLGTINVNDAKKRALSSERENKANQEAILRLLNEMGDLAEGDLTVRAKVTEDITGAIADSINYTIDELRGLVTEINKTSEQVTQASQEAQNISTGLLEAAEKQSQEIEDTSSQVLQMAQSINEVSANAAESARVAQQSLDAAEKGATAVRNSISGMNEIREHIQDTSKRIKRLGESSQEISEIVDLISDITEQTNILALNAAIQAASAGEAGRGFTVVAEEVQRLAERSGEATKQISAIVKTIQTDTQDAVSAMEKSTQGVVEGTKLSDAAGQALNEIGQVSRNLAELIETISRATQNQAQAAGVVANNMQEIQNITIQTTEGTKKTAISVSALATLATDLRGSVAGFKLS